MDALSRVLRASLVHEDGGASHAAPYTHTCAQDLSISAAELCEASDHLTDASYRKFVSDVDHYVRTPLRYALMPRGCVNAMEPPLYF